MKKLYTLLVVALIAATASAQVVKMDVGANQNRQMPVKGILKADKGAPAEGWLFYQDYLESYFGETCADGSAFYLKSDSLGLYEYSDGFGHAFVYSVSQTFDFESDFFDYASMGGDISFKHSPSLNVDSVCVYTMYLRDEQMPADVMDTLVIGFVADDNAPEYYYTNYPESSCFINFDYDPSTGVQQNAQVVKIPLGPNDVSEPADEPNSYYLKIFEIPVNITNVTAKRWNIAYTFISGENPALNDTLHSSFSLYTYNSNDGAGYNPSSGNPNICDNRSHGGMVRSFNNGDVDYFYPMFFFDNYNYPKNLGLKISCTNCEIVNVPEIEKNNPTVYPNPATNNFTVNLGNDEKANIQLFNIVGQQVYSETFTGSTNVSVANLHSGVYMLKINQNGKVYTTKVVVK
ncbi:MAG: T9SS type A sorting domain-containing protein [Bacteroidales bacterium]|nr:T9SS type A sorting domain-containing protein [Bacteroidales bacterium]